jgi:hypothetical protein
VVGVILTPEIASVCEGRILTGRVYSVWVAVVSPGDVVAVVATVRR